MALRDGSASVLGARRIAFGAHRDLSGAIDAQLDRTRFEAAHCALDGAGLNAFDAVVPLQISHYRDLAARADEGRGLAIVPDAAVAELCEDKLALNQALIAKGFGDHVPPLRGPGTPYPYVWKRRRGYWGRHARVVRSAADEWQGDDADWFGQTLVPGDVEYGSNILRADGRIWYAATTRYELARPDGVLGAFERPVRLLYQRGCEHLRLFAGILAALGYEGTACIDYKIVGGVPQIFEINPRFGASLAYDINAYLDAYLDVLGARSGAEPAP